MSIPQSTEPMSVYDKESGMTRVSSVHQFSLPGFVAVGRPSDHSPFRNPAFADNKNLPVHRWVPWIAGYSASFVDDVIAAYLPQGRQARVLDPFAGVGTTLLQAILSGHHAVGFEINPYAALVARTKLSAPTLNLEELDAVLNTMRDDATRWRTALAPVGVTPPPLKSRLPFFSPNVERQVLHALAFIRSVPSAPVADLLRTAFGAVMVSFSNYSYEPSLGSRPAAGKPLIEDADVARILLAKLYAMREDIKWLQNALEGGSPSEGRVINADFFSAQADALETASVDLMITSPPYMNNYHYVRNTRPQLYWLDFIASPGEQKYLETQNFGQYWQTVRDADSITLTFQHRDLETTLRQLRQTRVEEGAYGGPGWANYVTAYFNDCFRFMAALERVLVRGGTGVIVIGNSIIQGMDIRTETILGEIGELQGLGLEGVHCIREKRVGASITQSSVRQGERSRAMLSEYAVVVRKP
ncbi:MAG: site-specific DNA-methyltransferase [Anaerolineaceae bacterium]|nr:site-specific DNA-methyltransferase [Anaerolineaceae bacterium]